MLACMRQIRLRPIVAVLYAVAALTLGLAHKPLVASSDSRVELAAFALPDGSLPDICGSGQGNEPAHGHSSATCDACLVSHAPGLVLAAPPILGAPRLIATVEPVLLVEPVIAAPTRAPNSRGPPRFLTALV